MLIFGHVGFTIGAFSLLEEKLRLKIDYRIVLLGSLLPDIIDKPLGMIVLPLHNGRVLAHTLLFTIVLLAMASKSKSYSVLSIAVFFHLIEDEMWLEPETLLFPLYGRFPEKEFASFSEYLSRIAEEYTPSLSRTFIFEIVGLFIIVLFVMKKMRERSLAETRSSGFPPEGNSK